MIKIYTDGACSKNGRADSVGGYGVVVMEDDKIIDCYQHQEAGTTNNAQEMKAILWAYLHYGAYDGFNFPIVYSDSAYAINSFTQWREGWKRNGWIKSDGKPPENLDLIKAYDELVKSGKLIELKKVKGHNGIYGNELADKLATGEIKLN